MIRFDKGEIKNAGITITNDWTGAVVTIASATFEVFDSTESSVQESGVATVGDNSTVSPDIYGLVNTSVEAFVIGDSYKIKITYIISTETLIDTVDIKIVETKI